MHLFAQYLNDHSLEALTVSVTARVRYMTVYNAARGIPITPEHAQQIRQTVLAMSGVPFTGDFVLTRPEPIDDLPTLQIKKLPRHKRRKIH